MKLAFTRSFIVVVGLTLLPLLSAYAPIASGDDGCSAANRCVATCIDNPVPATGYGIKVVCQCEAGFCDSEGCDPLPCAWSCRLKIGSDGKQIKCPKLGNQIDRYTLLNNPGDWPECFDWHEDPHGPIWNSATPGDLIPGGSEPGLQHTEDCGGSSTETISAESSTSAAGATATVVFNCLNCEV